MKRFLTFFIFFVASQNLKANQFYTVEKYSNWAYAFLDTAVYPNSDLIKLSWACYIDQPINVLLKDLDRLFPNYILSKVYPGHRFFAHSIHIYYGNNLAIILSVRRFKFLNPSHTNPNWDIDLFCKENLSTIAVWQNDICLYKSNSDD